VVSINWKRCFPLQWTINDGDYFQAGFLAVGWEHCLGILGRSRWCNSEGLVDLADDALSEATAKVWEISAGMGRSGLFDSGCARPAWWEIRPPAAPGETAE